MKVTIIFGVLCAVVLQCFAAPSPSNNYADITSPLEKPYYQEVLRNMFPEIMNQKKNRVGRITNGSPAHLSQFPYQVYMYLSEQSGDTYLCGGSVINANWILTAAHCVDNIVKVQVFFGGINRYNDGSQGAAIQSMTVEKDGIFGHPNYNSRTIANDIGLVRLPQAANIGHEYIGLVNTPKGSEVNQNLVYEQGTVSGFGRTSDSVAASSSTLNWIKLPIAANSLCASIFGSAYVTDKHVCLQNVNAGGTCQGDSGGPLTIIGASGSTVQVGIVSYGAAAGCELNYPDVFTRVDQFIPWIESTTGISFS